MGELIKPRLTQDRIRRKIERLRVADMQTRQELEEWFQGEPIAAGQLAGRAVTERGREADLAKRRGVIIHTIIESPRDYPITPENSKFFARQMDRIVKFAKTLRNKGRLNPHMARILGLEERRTTKTSIIEQAH
jgi:hypothetical protein